MFNKARKLTHFSLLLSLFYLFLLINCYFFVFFFSSTNFSSILVIICLAKDYFFISFIFSDLSVITSSIFISALLIKIISFIYFNFMANPTTRSPPGLINCILDTDCKGPDYAGGCCMMIDFGAISPDLTKLIGFPSTK